MADKLHYNLTIADIRSKLTNPEDYVRRVLENMGHCRKQYGDASVRIGITGSGASPHYRIGPPDQDYPFDPLSNPGDPSPTDADLAPFFVAYNGRSHKRFEDWGLCELQPVNWSAKSMSFAEVRALLGDIRAAKNTRP